MFIWTLDIQRQFCFCLTSRANPVSILCSLSDVLRRLSNCRFGLFHCCLAKALDCHRLIRSVIRPWTRQDQEIRAAPARVRWIVSCPTGGEICKLDLNMRCQVQGNRFWKAGAASLNGEIMQPNGTTATRLEQILSHLSLFFFFFFTKAFV